MLEILVSLLSSAVIMVKNAMVDFVVYVLVDIVTKTPLREASNETEKRVIWLYETVVLMGLSLVFYAFFHPPYLLLLLTTFTFLYTQLLGRVDFRYWWQQLWTKWDEFQQHEESMEKLHELRAQQAAASMAPPSPIPPPTTHWMPNAQHFPPFMFNPNLPGPMGTAMPGVPPGPGIPAEMMMPAEAWYPADTEKGKAQQGPAVPPSEPPGVSPPARFRSPPHNVTLNFQPSPSIYSRIPEYMFNSKPSPIRGPGPAYMPIMPRGSELARKPLPGRSYLTTPPHHRALVSSSSFRSRVMSALGLNPYSSTPPGLQNGGQNLCFFNSILQCLAHSPGFLQCLAPETECLQCSDAEEALVTSLAELVRGLTAQPGTSEVCVLDTAPVRRAASCLPGSMVAHPSQQQQQQDVAESLMWLLHVLHNALNASRASSNVPDANGSVLGLEVETSRHPASPRYTSVTLDVLKFIYGDLNPTRIQELKEACRKEIEDATDVETEVYAEPLQRLADLEWLTYKERNNSAVDDLYTGQLVESQQCLACNRVSVGIQTFNILPVPLVEPRNLSGLVYLEDCFGKFGTVEHLLGPNGLRCENCNKRPVGKASSPPGHARVVIRDSLPIGASPILPNGGTAPGGLRRRHLVGSDSAFQTPPAATRRIDPGMTFVSPITGYGEVLDDSGFQDHHFRTSTPITATGPPTRLTDGQRRSLLRQLPECLIVQLLRYSYRNGALNKDSRPVSVPLMNLDLTQLIVDNVMEREDLTALNASYRYELYGLCLHLGGQSTAYGHYVSYTRAADRLWYRFDDERVTAVNMDYELNTRNVRENTYLLFYRKMPV